MCGTECIEAEQVQVNKAMPLRLSMKPLGENPKGFFCMQQAESLDNQEKEKMNHKKSCLQPTIQSDSFWSILQAMFQKKC